MGSMNGLKKFGLVVAVMLFGPLFLLSIISYTLNKTLADEEYTKTTIAEAGFYQAIGETIVTQAGGGAEGEPLITAALNTAVSGDRIQGTLEPLIDGTYSWLGGETKQPEFSLAIAPIKANFQESLTAGLQARAASLPACSAANPPSGEDIFDYNCIPPGTDVNATITDAVNKITNNASVFSDEVVADGTVNADEAEQLGINDPTQNLPSELPRAFQFFTNGLWFFVGGSGLAAVGIVFLSRNWLFGIRKCGILLVLNGLFVLILGLILGYVVSSLIPTTAVEATEATVNALEQASKIILADSASILKLVGIVSVVLGTVGIIASSVLIGKKKKPEIQTAPTESQPKV